MAVARRIVDHEGEPQSLPPQADQNACGPALAHDQSTPRPSPARMLQAELQRALTPGPVAPDRFSKRRAFKFIGPSAAGFWVLIAIVNHLSHA